MEESAPQTTRQFSLLCTRRFLPLFITQSLGAFNDNIFKNAIIILITYNLADSTSSYYLLPLAAGVFILPYFLFSASAGQLADFHEKSHLVRKIKIFEIILVLAGITALYFKNIPALLTILFCLGVQSTFFGPLKYSLLPQHLERHQLIAGNGLIDASTFLAILIGTIAGISLILLPYGLEAVSALMLLAALTGYGASRAIPQALSEDPGRKVQWNFFIATWWIIRENFSNKSLFRPVLAISWFWLIGTVYVTVFPLLTRDRLAASEQIITLFLVLFTVGVAIGSLACNKLLKGVITARYVPAATLIMAAASIDLYFACQFFPLSGLDPSGLGPPGLGPPGLDPLGLTAFITQPAAWRVMVDLFVLAIAGGLYIVPLYTLLQARALSTHVSRTIAANNIINAVFVISGVAFLPLIGVLGLAIETAFLGLGILNLLAALYMFCHLRKSNR